jgi:hypothetical protein
LKFVLPYLDEIIIYSNSVLKIEKQLGNCILQTWESRYVQYNKWKFFKDEIEILGNIFVKVVWNQHKKKTYVHKF